MFDPFDPKYARIELSNKPGLFFVVSKRHEEKVSQYKWHFDKKKRTISAYIDGKTTSIGQLLLGIRSPLEGDHISGNIFNSSDENLRESTRRQNGRNRQKQAFTSSQYKGVCWHKHMKMWLAQIKVNGKMIFLGYFSREEDAAAAYNKSALFHFGEFAELNSLPSTPNNP